MTPPDTNDLILAVAVIALGAIGTFLLLPHRLKGLKPVAQYGAGLGLSILAVALLALFFKPPGDLLTAGFFYLFSATSVVGGLLMITSRDPVHSALWFAMVILSTSALFLMAGAPFLAAGTVIVYAGAIIVTFLFVIMLAQQQGRAPYDRSARSPMLTTLSCFLLLWGLMYSLLGVKAQQAADRHALIRPIGRLVDDPAGSMGRYVLSRALTPTSLIREPANPSPTETPPHVVGLGSTLFADHLISVELAGFLLFVALVGAIGIAAPKPPIRPSRRAAAADLHEPAASASS
ncbi:MAG: NADH-quinone oxidoreductase subunit J [Isosphaeraceae bacterium]